ncbi:MAG TPA: hypothetical protein VF585_10810 [Chthoniobacterales bacterium]|jgi:hypothetical protein
MASLGESSARRKIVATLLVVSLVAGVQWIIYCRTRPPEPTVQFPKELRDIEP